MPPAIADFITSSLVPGIDFLVTTTSISLFIALTALSNSAAFVAIAQQYSNKLRHTFQAK